MSMYYFEDKKPEDAPSWARHISEAYETLKYVPQKVQEPQKPKNIPDSENTFLRDMLPACMLD